MFSAKFGFFLLVLSYILSPFSVVCARLSPGLSGEHHEREDAKERRTLVVFMEEQEQQLQIGKLSDTLRLNALLPITLE